MKSEKEKLLASELYDDSDPELEKIKRKAQELTFAYNNTPEWETEKRNALAQELLGRLGEGSALRGPIHFDYGAFTEIGKNCFANYNLTVLDCCSVKIGDNVLIGPGCTIAAPMHPFSIEERKIRMKEDGTSYTVLKGLPITIQDGCWICASVTICGGVTIGANSIIGAGSVVTEDIPSGVIASGNPCRVVSKIRE